MKNLKFMVLLLLISVMSCSSGNDELTHEDRFNSLIERGILIPINDDNNETNARGLSASSCDPICSGGTGGTSDWLICVDDNTGSIIYTDFVDRMQFEIADMESMLYICELLNGIYP